MNAFLTKAKLLWSDKSLRNRILFVLGMLIVFRLLAAIPVPGIDVLRLNQFLNNNQFFGVLNIFSGGGLSNLSIMMLGVGPYITASIILQLLTILVPRLKELYQEEGEIGRKRFAQYSRWLTVPLAMVQGFGLLLLLSKQNILTATSLFGHLTNLSVVVAGSVLLMWIGELMSEYGIGNGVSTIIFAGIVAVFPSKLAQLAFAYTGADLLQYILFALVGILIIAAVVYITEAERAVPVMYAKRVEGNKVTGGVPTYLPIRINQAGVMPIIFALSILLFPQLIGNLLSGSSIPFVASIARALAGFSQFSWAYVVTYFILVFLFTYFYTAVTFDPKQLSENLQRGGAFVPGVRPGEHTEEYFGKVVTRITFIGALFLGLIAVLPLIMQRVTGIGTIALGGTSILIVVSVVLDIIKKIEAQLSMREY